MLYQFSEIVVTSWQVLMIMQGILISYTTEKKLWSIKYYILVLFHDKGDHEISASFPI